MATTPNPDRPGDTDVRPHVRLVARSDGIVDAVGMIDRVSPAPTVSAERAFLFDVRLVLAVLNQARYPVFRRVFGVSPEQVNVLTFVLALSLAGATLEAIDRFIHHPWPLDAADTAIAAAVMREGGFGLAGQEIRKTHLFGGLIAVAAIGSITLPAIHQIRVTARRIGEQRMRIYGAAVERLKAERD